MLPILSVIVRSLDPARLKEEAERMFGAADFFDGDLAALDLGQLAEGPQATPDWAALAALFAGYGLRVVGIRNAAPELAESAAQGGLPQIAAVEPPARPQPAPAPEPEMAPPPATAPESAPEPAPPAEPAPPPAQATTLVIDKPLRSGQRVYARGGDVVVLAAVNTGAEVIADGSIHVYAPLRGRALAGASGDAGARIFTTRLEAELVSVAGLYRTFEDGVPADLAGRPAQIRLSGGDSPRLIVEPLAIA